MDGFGSVYMSCMCCLATCRKKGWVYRHTHFNDLPGKSLHHNPNRSNNNFNFIMNDFTGLKSDENDDLSITAYYGIGGGTQGGFPVREKTETYFNHDVIEELRLMYYSTHKPDPIKCDVAVHIRRGDISFKKNGVYGSDRLVSLEYYKSLIDELRKNNEKLKFAIFSEGKKEQFEILEHDDVEFYLNVELCKTFHSMVEAPILITSPSMLSATAALLNKGKIYWAKWSGFIAKKHWVVRTWNHEK